MEIVTNEHHTKRLQVSSVENEHDCCSKEKFYASH